MVKRALKICLVEFVGFSKKNQNSLWLFSKIQIRIKNIIEKIISRKNINHIGMNTLPRDEQCCQQNRNTICTTTTTMVVVQHYLCYFHERSPKISDRLVFQKTVYGYHELRIIALGMIFEVIYCSIPLKVRFDPFNPVFPSYRNKKNCSINQPTSFYILGKLTLKSDYLPKKMCYLLH